MASQAQQLHFILFPLMAQGHMIPMIDIARLLARRGVIVTILTTPLNANRFRTVVARDKESGLRINFVELRFPCAEAGLPEGCENFDTLPSLDMANNFFIAIGKLQEQTESVLEELKPPPSCIISDMGLPWTTTVANKLHIPRLIFHGTCCFSLMCSHSIRASNLFDSVSSDSEYFVVPGLPHRIELTKAQLPSMVNSNSAGLNEVREKIRMADQETYGIVVNSFEELEPEYVKEYRKAKGENVWCIGPVSLCNTESLDKSERGNRASIDEHECLEWLNSRQPGSVVYACLGSLCRLTSSQLMELGLGLEASNRPFVWALSGKSDEVDKWLSEGFEERIRERGLLIRGWAPQLVILSHPAIGGFITHCGWNSTLEGVCAGVPMVTWPLFAEQFCNEKLVVQVLRIGVKVGVEVAVKWGEEEKMGVLVKMDDVKESIDKLMDGGEEGEEMRERARKLGKNAKRAIEEGGSSHLNMTLLIRDIMEQKNMGNGSFACA